MSFRSETRFVSGKKKIKVRNIVLHRRAEKGMRGLSAYDKRYVDIALDDLRHFQTSSSPVNPNVQILHVLHGRAYSYRVNQRLRMIFEVMPNGEIMVQDIASHDALMRYFNWGGV